MAKKTTASAPVATEADGEDKNSIVTTAIVEDAADIASGMDTAEDIARRAVADAAFNRLANVIDGGAPANPVSFNTPPSEPDAGAGNSASPVEASAPVTDDDEDRVSSIIVFDLSQEPTIADAQNLKLVLTYLEDFVEAGDLASVPDMSAWTGMSRQQFQEAYPKTFDLFATFTGGEDFSGNMPMVRVTSSVDGFRRGGMAHPRAPVSHTLASLTPDQVELFLSETNLTVELV